MDYTQVFIEIMSDFQKHYSYLKYKKYTIVQLVEKYKNEFSNITSKEEFTKKLARILSLFEDPHVNVVGPNGERYEFHKKKPIPNFDLKVTHNYLKKIIIENKAGILALLKKDIIYLNIFSWNNKLKTQIIQLMDYFTNFTDKYSFNHNLIIDVRLNGGGNNYFAELFLSTIIPPNKEIPVTNYYKRTDINDPNKIALLKNRTVKGNPKANFQGNIVVLIGNECMSSNEFFCIGASSIRKHIDNNPYNKLILIGDTTFGSSGNPKEFSHPIGIKYRMPSWICHDFNDELFEGKGVEPTIKIKSKKTISWGRDLALKKAIQILSKHN